MLDLHDRVNQVHETRRGSNGGVREQVNGARRYPVTIGITGKYAALRDAYASIDKALEHCAAHLSRNWTCAGSTPSLCGRRRRWRSCRRCTR